LCVHLTLATWPAWTRPEARGQGAAPRLLSAALDHARRHGVGKVLLHATEAGRPLYLREGFEPSAAYMELRLPAEL
jgi:GNAT superfamily N-acetyltransferase